ncbi:uncharacterized protein LOC131310843 isoform X3 [Rhododendron vialii]|uniref:uncharacterized protein LOC131310843 isoform X3 n=1 Tax=Rhododendron vialii TaxID=182163 RepID=UPI00265DDB26|nr:uncharacterized protein LOC131310843 isoform X3 [Rhododendron vialii]
MDSKNKTQSSLCAAERDGAGTWLIPSPVLMAASVIHIPMLCSSPGKARQHGKHGQKGMWMNSSSRPSRKASCGELDPLGLNLYYGGRKWAFYACRTKAFLPLLPEEWSFDQTRASNVCD